VKLVNVVLFLHIAVAIGAFALASLLHGCDLLMRRANTVAELRTLAKPGRLGPAFGVFVLLLLGLGSWLVHLSKGTDNFGFGTPFVWTAIVALGYLFIGGPAVLDPLHKKLIKAADAAGDGPVTPELRAIALNRVRLAVSYSDTFLALAVVFNMATKPGTAGCIVVLVVGLVVGLGLGSLNASPVKAAATAA
jgi:hypothetical protein